MKNNSGEMKDLEADFIERLRNGDNEAYRALYARYYGLLCHAADRYLHDRFQAECIVENVIFNIWERREQINIRTSLRSYLAMSVRNASINYLRSCYKRNEMLMSHMADADRQWIESASTNALPTDDIINEETIAQVLSCLGSDECRKVFVKSRFESLSYKEIADELGISVNTVKYHMKNALARIAKEYSSYFAFLALFCIGEA